jgi:tetracycline 7-halogenase / FADH2 O2-dependent halogenase
MGLIQDCDIVNPVFGWKDPEKRFIAPSTPTMARFMLWAVTGPDEMRAVGREFMKGVFKAGAKARKVL